MEHQTADEKEPSGSATTTTSTTDVPMPSTIWGRRRRPDTSADWDLLVGSVVPFDVIHVIDEATGAVAGIYETRQRRRPALGSPEQDTFDDEDAV